MKKWVILCLNDMRVRSFDCKDDVKAAVLLFKEQNKPIQVYRHNEAAGCYAMQEIFDLEVW